MKIKKLPDPIKYPILPPDMDYIYFEHSKDFPFESSNTEFSFVNCWWLAESSFLVYCHPGFARLAFKLAGFNHFSFFQGTGTECMVAWNKGEAIITFRGTELNSLSTLHEIGTDLNSKPIPFELGGKVHKGFLNALEEIWSGDDGLESFISSLKSKNNGINIWITGHSLGGALAGLCFARIKDATGLYMFGAPRIGDEEFVRLTMDRSVWRVENCKDPIPLVPLHLPKLNFNFYDMGSLIFLDSEHRVINTRPELTPTEHKDLVLDTINNQKDRRSFITNKITSEKNSKKKSMEVYAEVNEHLKGSIREWTEYVNLLKSDTKINVTDHMPIYYAIKCFNNILSS